LLESVPLVNYTRGGAAAGRSWPEEQPPSFVGKGQVKDQRELKPVKIRVAAITVALTLMAAAPALGQVVSFGPGSWCWFGDPRAVHVVGKFDQTFVGWLDQTGAVVVGSYDNRSGAVQSAVVGKLWHDDHGSPSLLVSPTTG
jgi:hypothetical protein